jgi:hypothetical protein
MLVCTSLATTAKVARTRLPITTPLASKMKAPPKKNTFFFPTSSRFLQRRYQQVQAPRQQQIKKGITHTRHRLMPISTMHSTMLHPSVQLSKVSNPRGSMATLSVR